MSPINSEFRARRRELGLSQRDLARLLGVTRPRVSQFERGEAPVTGAAYRRALDVLLAYSESKR